jgi:hypothetical protein
MNRWRWLSRLYAAVFGYFWMPCPVCGRFFGGHEAGEFAVYRPGLAMGRVTCRDAACEAVGKASTDAHFWEVITDIRGGPSIVAMLAHLPPYVERSAAGITGLRDYDVDARIDQARVRP